MREKMRGAAWTLLCLTVSLLPACTGKAPEYPDLEGYWKQERIEYRREGKTEGCNRLFWALQLGVTELKDLGNNGYGTYLCRYEYDEGKGTLRLFDFRKRSDQSPLPDAGQLKAFGIPSENVIFEVVSLDKDKMVLCAGDTALYFRSF